MTQRGEESGIEPNRQASLELLLTDLPGDYTARYAAIQAIRHAFHREIAVALEPAINERVSQMPQDTPEERQNLASWINEQLRQIGLAAKCPVTGRPASIVVDRQDREHPEITRFRYGVRSEDGKYSHNATSRNLGEFKLTEHSPRVEALAKSFRKTPSTTPGR
jgi:hypothetical protein